MPIIKDSPAVASTSTSSSGSEQTTANPPSVRKAKLANQCYQLSTPSPEERHKHFISGRWGGGQQQEPPRVGVFTAAEAQSPGGTSTDVSETSLTASQSSSACIQQRGAGETGDISLIHERMACAQAVHSVAYDDVQAEYPKNKMLEMAMLARYPYSRDNAAISTWIQEDTANQSVKTYNWNWELDRDTGAKLAEKTETPFRHRDGMISSGGLVAYLMKQRDTENYCLTFGGTSSGSTIASNNLAIRMIHNTRETAKQWTANTKAFVGHIPDIYKTAERIVSAANQIAKDRGGKLVVTGHSLGGAMATFATAIQRAQGDDVKAYPFSAAPLNKKMEKKIIRNLKDGISMESVVDGITETHIANDIVSGINNLAGTLNVFGKTITVTSSKNPNFLNAHDKFLDHIKAFTNPSAADTKVRCDTTNRLFENEIVSIRQRCLVVTDPTDEKILKFVDKYNYERAGGDRYAGLIQ